MTLLELSGEYRASGDQLRRRLRVLRRARREEENAEACWHLDRRIAVLTEMLRQTNELTTLTEHYYERGYWRNERYTL